MSSLRDKAGSINFDEDDDVPAVRAPDRPRTGPGAISASLAMGREVVQENERLKARVAELEDAEVIEFLDPKTVIPSEFANRNQLSFHSEEFTALRREVESAGRNVQPIKVRRLNPPRGEARYEIVFGHRRHQACLELGLKIAAIIVQVSDEELFAEMDRENRARANLSPWEQGVMYAKALDRKLFPSIRRMAEQLGADAGNVSKAIQLASLPEEVIAAFPSPLDLQFRWGGLLQGAVNRNQAVVYAQAEAIQKMQPRPASKDVLELLIGAANNGPVPSTDVLSVAGKAVGSWTRDARGALTLKLKAGVLPQSKEQKLREFVGRLLS